MPTLTHVDPSVQGETPTEDRVVLVDSTPRHLRNQTQVVETSTVTTITVRELRGRQIRTIVQEVRRLPRPDFSPALPWEGRRLYEYLTAKSVAEAQARACDDDWLRKVDLDQLLKVFPPGNLRSFNYLLEYHIPALHITGLLDNLGPETRFDPIGYLELSEPGRAYLQSIVSDTVLQSFAEASIGEQPGFDAYLIGYIFINQTDRIEEGLFEYEDWPTWKDFCLGCFMESGTVVNCTNPNHHGDSDSDSSSSDTSATASDTSDWSTYTPAQRASLEHPGAPWNQQA